MATRRGNASRVPAEKRCEALVRDMYGRPTNDRCGAHATIKIGRRRLCNKHAALHALTLALENGTAHEIPFLQPPRRGGILFIEDRDLAVSKSPARR